MHNVDPDQTPQDAASDLGLHCLLMPLFYGTLGINGLTTFVPIEMNKVLDFKKKMYISTLKMSIFVHRGDEGRN